MPEQGQPGYSQPIVTAEVAIAIDAAAIAITIGVKEFAIIVAIIEATLFSVPLGVRSQWLVFCISLKSR